MGRTILVVEGDSSFRGLLQNGFRRAGYDVLIAANSQHGMRIAALHWPDAALIEVETDTGGVELFESVRSYSARTGGKAFPAWMMTRDTTPEIASRGLAAGAVGVIIKPFSPAEIISTIDAHFSKEGSPPPTPLMRARNGVLTAGNPPRIVADNLRTRVIGR